MIDILKKIMELRKERNWTEYELAKNSGLTQSTISTWYRKGQIPTIQTLDKICKGFGITLSQFFAEGDNAVYLSDEQRALLDNWASLTPQQKKALVALLNSIE